MAHRAQHLQEHVPALNIDDGATGRGRNRRCPRTHNLLSAHHNPRPGHTPDVPVALPVNGKGASRFYQS